MTFAQILLGDNTFAFEARGRRVVENAFGTLSSRFRALLGTIEQRSKFVRDIVLTCVVLHNMLQTYQGTDVRAPTPADDVAVIANEPVLYVPDENCRNPSRGTKQQRDLLKDYFNHIGALAGQEERI